MLVGRWLRIYLVAKYYLVYYLGGCVLGVAKPNTVCVSYVLETAPSVVNNMLDSDKIPYKGG